MLSAKGDLDHMLHVRGINNVVLYKLILKWCMHCLREEIRRIKANNPDISHREAFSTAAKNWAHFPNIHFGLGPYESSNKLDETIGATGHPRKIQDPY
ncbi:hypothetical protein Zm00014a_022033 [Zea mays]|uniref:Protein YABBY 2 n=1 Tax=Zea mays TaxID=4577 RepID=A0A317Y6S9_MAIZE|nr:Protein YABBY 2 [Zea mays]PWZ54113.1 hypothetical protein Zm00014a_022033 [Zea mays]